MSGPGGPRARARRPDEAGSGVTTGTAPHADLAPVEVVAKPWGHEAIFAAGEHGYVGKLITVRAGESLSLQYHVAKDETIVVVSGEALLECGPSADRLVAQTLRLGDTAHLPPTVVHRVTAVGDLLFAEVSTAAPGWRDDVVRLADRYGRGGTTSP